MLGTIKVPLNMKKLQAELPNSNYESDRPKREKKASQSDPILDDIAEADEQAEGPQRERVRESIQP